MVVHSRRLIACLALLGILLAAVQPASGAAQAPRLLPSPEADEDSWLDDQLGKMTAADRVGQLFLVTFREKEVGEGSEIARLVQELRVGGIILAPENGNFTNEASTPQQALSLTTALQSLAFSTSAPVTVTNSVPVTFTAPVEPSLVITPTAPQVLSTTVTVTQVITFAAQARPLFLAVSQEGDGYPYTALRSGFSELPSSMALGATWDDRNAEAAGRITGKELAAVGVNMLLGPSLDVLTEPRLGLSDQLGTRAFGGDPYWTGRMGTSYVRGVHLGSQGRVATVAKHLPGLGASDRSLEEEVSTVDKSLQDLRLIELPPFFAVTQTSAVTDTTDALLTAHIRYRGFQGNIRYVTPPISLNAQGMEQIMSLPELQSWREKGGILVSDSLGVPAIRRYFSPGLTSFPHRQIALDAFQAGNDLLMLSRFSLTDNWDDEVRNIEDTILFFRRLYDTDSSFRSKVDQSVRRILQLKHRLFPDFSLETSIGDASALATIGASGGTVAQIGQQAVSLLYPSADELALRMARPPQPGEDIVVFTDAREVRECESCPPFSLLAPTALRDTILRLYGPDATGQVTPEHIEAYTFAQLRGFLTTGSPNLSQNIRNADWIVFAMLDYAPDSAPDSTALKQFLRERATSPETQKVVVLAYGAPYYLDTTEVSKLTAYYGVYSKIASFVETSARALFLEFGPTGRSPVTVEGVGYDLAKQLAPNPDQVIEVLAAKQPASTEGAPQPLSIKAGDSLTVHTSVILDRNGNPVPDGTPVLFHYIYQGEGLGGQTAAVTVNGVAQATITLEREGELQITATSDPCMNSRPLLIRLSGGTAQFLTPTPEPTATATSTPTPTPVPSATSTAAPTPTPTEVVIPASLPPPPEPRVRWIDLVLSLVGMAAAGGVVYMVGQRLHLQARFWNPSARLALWSGVCGLIGYLFYGLALPGSRALEAVAPGLRGLLIGFVCGLLPLVAAAWSAQRAARER